MASMTSPSDILRRLKQRDLAEVRYFANPPEVLKVVVKAVCIMLGHNVSNYQWKDISRVLGDMTLFEKLEDCDPTPEAIQQAKEALGDTTKDMAMMCSTVSGILFQWLQAMFDQ